MTGDGSGTPSAPVAGGAASSQGSLPSRLSPLRAAAVPAASRRRVGAGRPRLWGGGGLTPGAAGRGSAAGSTGQAAALRAAGPAVTRVVKIPFPGIFPLLYPWEPETKQRQRDEVSAGISLTVHLLPHKCFRVFWISCLTVTSLNYFLKYISSPFGVICPDGKYCFLSSLLSFLWHISLLLLFIVFVLYIGCYST